MKKIGWVVLFAAACRLFAADGTWTGAAGDGVWTNSANWAGGIMPSGGGLAIFNGTDSGRTIAPDGISGTFAGARVTAGSYTISATTPSIDVATTGSGVLFDIAPGCVLTNKMKLTLGNKKMTLTGGGDYAHGGEWLSSCTGIDVLQGTFWVVSGVTGDGLNLNTNRITVASGARLNFRSVNSLSNEAEIYIENGGLVDFGGCSDVIGGISGAGTAINVPDITFSLAKKAYRFSGIMTGGGAIQLSRPDANLRSFAGFEIGSATGCMGVAFRVVDTNALRFAKGIGSFRVLHVGEGGSSPAAPFALVDSDGRPITLRFGDNGDREVRSEIGGSGGLRIEAGAFDKNITFKTNVLYTGATVALVGNVHFGDGVAASGIPLNTSEYQVYTNASLFFKPTNNLVVPQKVSGFGAWVRVQTNNNIVTFNDLRLTNGTLYAGNSNSANKVITRGGSATNTTFRADYAATNRIEGGRWFGPVFSAQPSAALELAGGWSTNAMQVGSGSQLSISGGEHWFIGLDAYGLGNNSQIVRQSGGISGFFAPQGYVNTNDVFAYVSGGTMYSWNSGHTRGLGLDASGDGKFIMFYGAQPMRISSDGRSHSVTVRDRAYVDLWWLRILSQGGTGSIARINLDGGTFAVRTLEFGDFNPTNQTILNFNGAVFRQSASAPGAFSFPSSPYLAYNVGAGGLKLDLLTDNTASILGPLLKGTAAGVSDGGLQVTGIGALSVRNTVYADGPVVFANGSGQIMNVLVSPFVAATDMTLAGSILDVVGSGGDSSALAMTLLPSGGSLKVGPGGTRFLLQRSGRASLTLTVPEIVRLNGAMYPISAKSGAAGLGTLELLKSTVAPTVSNGIVLASAVFGTDESSRPLSFVGYDDAKGFVPITTYSDTVKRIATSGTVSDAALTGLRVDAATATLSGATDIKSLILNCTSGASGVRAIVTGGALSVPEEMFIWNNTSYNQDDYAMIYRGGRIESPLQGSGTIQIGASEKNGGVGGPYLEFVPASPNFTGTVRIHSGRVEAANNGAFGTGTIEVYGNAACGGTFFNTRANAVYTNAFKLCGMGWGANYGAVTAMRDVSFEGSVELIGDARIQSLRYAAQVNFNKTVSGAGRLETVATAGRIVLKKPSTYQGGTLITSGTLEVSGEGTLGAGEVVNNGALIFSVSSDAVVTNDISGTGAIWIAGPGKVTFSGKVTCSGGVQTLANGTGSAAGSVSSLGSEGAVSAADGTVANVLSGTGSVEVASGSVTVNGGTFGGVISGSGGLIKAGLKPLTLYGKNTYSGSTLISEGTLRLAGAASLVTDGLQYRLDAQNFQSLTVDGNGRVTQWNSQTSTVTFVQTNNVVFCPVYNPNGLNGLPSLSFAAKTNRLYTTTSVVCRTVFIVNKPNWAACQNLGGVWGASRQDRGIRYDGGNTWQFPGDSNSFASWQCYVNGVATAAVGNGVPHVLAVISSSAQTWSTAIGNYWGELDSNGAGRSYAGEIGEVLVYGGELYPGDRAQVEQFLINRWNLPGAQAAVTENVLPTGTALSISDFGSLDLNGISQSVGSLAGGGSIVNSGSAAVLTVGSDNTDTVFTGSFGAGITLVKTGTGTLRITTPFPAGMKVKVLGGTLALPVDNALAELEVAGTVDTDGRTLTVAKLSGSGQIIDAVLRVTESVTPVAANGYATLNVPADTQLSGVLTARIGPNAAADCVQGAGALSLSSLSLTVVKQGALNSPAHTVIRASAVSGTFVSTTLPSGAGVRYTATRADVTFAIGTRLILR